MTGAGDIEAFQAEVAWLALAAIDGHGFALAGAGALIAHGLTDRSTQDLDLFSPLPGGAGQVTATLQQALRDAGFGVTVDSSPTAAAGEFARLEVTRGDHSVQIDLGRDWRQHPPIIMAVGPVLHLGDAVGNKVGAMIGRGLPRDYLDVAAALQRYDAPSCSSWPSGATPDCARPCHRLGAGGTCPYSDEIALVNELLDEESTDTASKNLPASDTHPTMTTSPRSQGKLTEGSVGQPGCFSSLTSGRPPSTTMSRQRPRSSVSVPSSPSVRTHRQ